PATPQDLPAETSSVGAAKVGIITNMNTGETIWEADSSTGTPQDSPAGPSEVLDRTEPIEWDILTESRTRSANPPGAADTFNLAAQPYDGSINGLRGTLYTNYCFYPNASGYLYYRFYGYTSSSSSSTTATVRVYDMTAGMYVTTYKSQSFNNQGYSFTRAVSGLNTQHKYYLAIINSGNDSGLYPAFSGTIQVNHQNAF
ncbi:MAG: hypothetical protein AB7C89_00710, partial [Intestinibacillus sp.]